MVISLGSLVAGGLKLSVDDLRNWLQPLGIGLFIWLLFSINWRKFNQVMTTKVYILSIACFIVFSFPSVWDFIISFIQGVIAGFNHS